MHQTIFILEKTGANTNPHHVHNQLGRSLWCVFGALFKGTKLFLFYGSMLVWIELPSNNQQENSS